MEPASGLSVAMAESNISQVTHNTPPKGEEGQAPSRLLLSECRARTNSPGCSAVMSAAAHGG
jgi:hypothetical protein